MVLGTQTMTQNTIFNYTNMKSIHHSALIGTVTLMLMASSARADLLTGTDPAFGANSLTIDTQTELAWLNLSFTAGLSYNQVLADTQPGGIFSGYTFATSQQVADLFTDAGIGATGEYPLSTPAIGSFISLIDSTGSINGYPGFNAINGTSADPGQEHDAQCIYAVGDTGTEVYFVEDEIDDAGYGNTFSDPSVSDWLVQAVPEPGVWSIAIAGLIAFAFVRRLKRTGEVAN